jgi:hypothetical protein
MQSFTITFDRNVSLPNSTHFPVCSYLSHTYYLFLKLTFIFDSIAVMTLCACTPPLDQVLQLWDFLLAFGVHLNVLCVIAQLLLMRDELMMSKRCVFPL